MPLPIEALELRRVLSVSLNAAGWLHVVGDAGTSNTITVQLSADKASYAVDLNGVASSYPAAGVRSISIQGGTVDDTLKLLSTAARKNAVYGGAGNDTVVGVATTRGNGSPLGWVRLWGQDGNDTLRSIGGRAFIDCGRGNDKAVGSDSDDLIDGFAGNDTLFGGGGQDTISGGAGDDSILGNDGRDSLDGGAGDDYLQGGNNGDVLSGGAGSDTLFGDAGSDLLNGGAGQNYLFGDGGDDVLVGESALDTLVGGTGADSFSGNHAAMRVQQTTTDMDSLERLLHARGDALKAK